MTALLAGEWLKLRTLRAPAVLAGIAVGFPVLITTLFAVFVPLRGFAGSRELVDVVSGSATFSMLLMAVSVAVGLTGEYAHGTIRVTYAVTPVRSRVLLAKLLLGSIVAAAVAVVAIGVSWAIGAVVLASRGADVGLSMGDGTLGTLLALAAFWVVGSWFGFGLALLLRGTALAVTLLLVYPLILEPIVAGISFAVGAPGLTRWLPFSAGVDAVSMQPGDLGRPLGLVWFGAVSLALGLIASAVELRRDA